MPVQEPPRTHLGCRDCSASRDSLIRAYDRKCSGRVMPLACPPGLGEQIGTYRLACRAH